MIAGTTGESATLTKEEHVQLVADSVRLAAGRIGIIAGTGSNSTAQTVDLSREVAAVGGVSACLVVTPYYNKPTQEGLYRHYAAVAEAVDLPLVLYNVPGRTGLRHAAGDGRPIGGARRHRVNQGGVVLGGALPGAAGCVSGRFHRIERR